MAPLRGWAPRGQRIRAKVPHGRWQTMTFMAALRHDRITAPWFIEGPINGEAFLLYIEKVLVPTLRHGDIVIMDNLGSHKASAVQLETELRTDPGLRADRFVERWQNLSQSSQRQYAAGDYSGYKAARSQMGDMANNLQRDPQLKHDGIKFDILNF